jgi:hypothetical protein
MRVVIDDGQVRRSGLEYEVVLARLLTCQTGYPCQVESMQ